jgi:hypothetical protein
MPLCSQAGALAQLQLEGHPVVDVLHALAALKHAMGVLAPLEENANDIHVNMYRTMAGMLAETVGDATTIGMHLPIVVSPHCADDGSVRAVE